MGIQERSNGEIERIHSSRLDSYRSTDRESN